MRRKVFSPKELKAIESLTDVNNFKGTVLSLIHTLDVGCETQDAHPIVAYGARSSSEQWRIYSIGRTKDDGGVWHRNPGQSVYTQSTPSQSAHCYAAAADIALVYDKTGMWLDGSDPLWDWLSDHAKDLGLASGRDWRRAFGPYGDAAHVELKDWKQIVARGELTLVED